MGQVGCIYMNFGLWALALVPSWLVIRQFGLHSVDKKVDREKRRLNADDGKTNSAARNEVAV
jgi:hypothetical protein